VQQGASDAELVKKESKGAAEPDQQSTLVTVLLPVLTVIGTGIGAIGFVIFFGGFIVWARFKAIGLPANEAVAQVPRNDLVVTGASFLVPALLGALLAATVAVAAWDRFIGSKRRDRKVAARADLMRANAKLTQLQSERDRSKEKIETLEARINWHHDEQKHTEVESEGRDKARAASDALEVEQNKLLARRAELEGEEIPAAEKKRAELIEAQSKAGESTRNERALQIAIGAFPMFIAEVIVIAIGWHGLSPPYRWLLVAVVITTITIAVVALSMTDHFAWFSFCVVLGVGVTIAASTYARTQRHPKVSPVAALAGSTPVAGFFVAETSDALYLGVPKRPRLLPGEGGLDFSHGAATLVRVPKSQVSGLTVGPIMDEEDAYRRSIVLALALCRQPRLATKPVKRKVEQIKRQKLQRRCDLGSAARLRKQLAATTWNSKEAAGSPRGEPSRATA
jgi:hypothetical protein